MPRRDVPERRHSDGSPRPQSEAERQAWRGRGVHLPRFDLGMVWRGQSDSLEAQGCRQLVLGNVSTMSCKGLAQSDRVSFVSWGQGVFQTDGNDDFYDHNDSEGRDFPR